MSVQTPRKKAAKKTAAKKTVAKKTVAKKSPAAKVCKATIVRVDPRVMTEAKLIVFGGRYTKIEVIDARTVVVR